jgi:hypothetical protein
VLSLSIPVAVYAEIDTLTQDPVNSPIMRDDVEAPIYNAVAAGESPQFTARAVHGTAGDVAASGLQIDAHGSNGSAFHDLFRTVLEFLGGVAWWLA